MNRNTGRYGMNAGFSGPLMVPTFGPGPRPPYPMAGDPGFGMHYAGYERPPEGYRPRAWHMRSVEADAPLALLVNTFNRLRAPYSHMTHDLAYLGSLETMLYSLPPDVVFEDPWVDALQDMQLAIDSDSLLLSSPHRIWCKLERIRTCLENLHRSLRDGQEPNTTDAVDELEPTQPITYTNASVLMAVYEEASARYSSVCGYSADPMKYRPLTKEEYLQYAATKHAMAPANREVTNLWVTFSRSPFACRGPHDLEEILEFVTGVIRAVIREETPAEASDQDKK